MPWVVTWQHNGWKLNPLPLITLIVMPLSHVQVSKWYVYPRGWVLFKPSPPVGAGGGYMFSGRPSVRASVRSSVIHVVVLCFRDISSICWQTFAKLLSLMHLGTQMTWLRFWPTVFGRAFRTGCRLSVCLWRFVFRRNGASWSKSFYYNV